MTRFTKSGNGTVWAVIGLMWVVVFASWGIESAIKSQSQTNSLSPNIPDNLTQGRYVYQNQTCTQTTTINGTQFVGIRKGNVSLTVQATATMTYPTIVGFTSFITTTQTLYSTSEACVP